MLRVLRFTTFPWPALLYCPHLPAVVIATLDDTRGKRRFEELRLVTYRFNKSCLGPGIGAQGLPADGVGLFTGTGLVTDTGHEVTGSNYT
jgi:hypothetical protein